MSNRPKSQWSGWPGVLALVSVVSVIWGFERWRQKAASTAGQSQHTRLRALAQCMLGHDGLPLLRRPEGMRQRLRALAMQSSMDGLTWLDRCLPLARSLANHAFEVDNTAPFTAATPSLTQSSRDLLRAVERTALVWRIRAGDPDADMGYIADTLSLVAQQIDYFGQQNSLPLPAYLPVAPALDPRSEGAFLPTTRLEPSSLGTADEIFLGTPLPYILQLSFRDNHWETTTLPGNGILAWKLGASSLVRLERNNNNVSALAQGLTLRVFRPNENPFAVPLIGLTESDLRAMHADAAPDEGAMWFAYTSSATNDLAAVVTHFNLDGTSSTISLPITSLEQLTTSAASQNSQNTQNPQTTPAREFVPERIAITESDQGAWVAYSLRGEGDISYVRITSITKQSPEPTTNTPTTTGTNNPHTTEEYHFGSIVEQQISGRNPTIEICARTGHAPLITVTTTNEWSVNRINADHNLEVLSHHIATNNQPFDRDTVVHCTRDGMVVHAREFIRNSPVIVCNIADQCHLVMAPESPIPPTMFASYITPGPNGQNVTHAQWPILIAPSATGLVFTRAVGTMVATAHLSWAAFNDSVQHARREGYRESHRGVILPWSSERVIFDAAAQTRNRRVAGLGLYTSDRAHTIAVSVSDGLYLFRSNDGVTWH